MKDATLTGTGPRSEEECKAEIDRLALEIRQMLDQTRRNNDAAKRIGEINRKTLDDLEKMVLCGKE